MFFSSFLSVLRYADGVLPGQGSPDQPDDGDGDVEDDDGGSPKAGRKSVAATGEAAEDGLAAKTNIAKCVITRYNSIGLLFSMLK